MYASNELAAELQGAHSSDSFFTPRPQLHHMHESWQLTAQHAMAVDACVNLRVAFF